MESILANFSELPPIHRSAIDRFSQPLYSDIFGCLSADECHAQLSILISIVENKTIVGNIVKNGESLIRYACRYMSTRCVKLLLDHGADINDRDASVASLLFEACRNLKLDTMALLIKNGCDANETVDCGIDPERSLLSFACAFYDSTVVQCLIANGARVNDIDMNGCTPLIYAAYYGRSNILSTLLDNGSLIDISGLRAAIGEQQRQQWQRQMEFWQPSALYFAIESDSDDCVKLLIDNGADVDYCGSCVVPSLIHMACRLERLNMAILLINAGCYYDIQLLKNFEIIGQLFYYIDLHDSKKCYVKRASDY